jgi:hypothetical protein
MKKSGHRHPFDIPRLRKYGHQEANHNWMSATMTVLYVHGGKEGMYPAAVAAVNHLMQNLMSDIS